MRRHLTPITLTLALAAIVILWLLGMAVWVFLPLLPAAGLLIVILTGWRQAAEPEAAKSDLQDKGAEERPKAA